ncbi:MAG: Flp pilus assembly complex ATPase component TadA, partial [Phycisphaerales bacterium]|nr:Flp pilus assembly complex ATPase component TadA [Phycisphaerales bacterium]
MDRTEGSFVNLGQILQEDFGVSPDQLEMANQKCGPNDRLDQVIVRMGLCSEWDVLTALGKLHHFDVVDLNAPDIQVDLETMKKMPSKLLHRAKLIPLNRENGSIRVATRDPFQLYAFDELRMLTGLDIHPVLAKENEISEVINKYFGVASDTVSQLIDEDEDLQVVSEVNESSSDLAEMAQDASVVKLVNDILLEAINERASDIHIEPFEHDLSIRYRVDGVLRDVNVPPQIRKLQAAIISRIKILSNLNIAERRIPQDGSFKIKAHGREIDLRVSIIPMIHGEGVVMRILDKQSILLTLEDLGFTGEMKKQYEHIIAQPHGILLVTGPTGSGKTTSLYASLNSIVTPEIKVLTVEDPVEYNLDGINQVNVNVKAGLTFAKGMRAFLRHDPDVIMVGEIRDLETAETAVQASLTGHFVFSTLHTNDAPSATTRMLDMGVEPFLVASSVEAVLAQRLVRTICKHCKEAYEPDPLDVPPDMELKKGEKVYKGRGCRECRNSGFSGRKGIFELMLLSDEIRELVLQRASAGKIKKVAR